MNEPGPTSEELRRRAGGARNGHEPRLLLPAAPDWNAIAFDCPTCRLTCHVIVEASRMAHFCHFCGGPVLVVMSGSRN